MKRISRARVEKILAALGFGWADLCRMMNRHFGTVFTVKDTRKWGKTRTVPLPAIVFLRMAVAIVQLRRGRRR